LASKNTDIVSTLNSVIDVNTEKYSYLYARYLNDVSFSFRNTQAWSSWNYAFDLKQDTDLLMSAYTNVIKSVIDTATSKIASQKVRPYFTPVNGLYKTRQVVRQIQEYFDNIYEQANIHEIMAESFRDGCIAGKGYVYINPVTYEISSLKPHTVGFLESECKYGSPKRMLIKYVDFPSSKLKEYGIEKPRKVSTVTLWHYIDCEDHEQEFFVNGKSVKTLPYKPDILPIVELYYNKAVWGTTTVSLVQELDGIQTQIDIINAKVSAASQLNPGNVTYVIEGSNLSTTDVDNRVGKVFGVRMPPGTNTPPVVNVSPSLFDPMWLQLLEMYIKQAYDVTGISQLSAMSKKPAGADSGVALQTLEDVESDRLEIATAHYIQAYTDLAKVIIEVLPEKENILPESLNNSSMKWKDVKEQTALFKIQYSTATSLSKNPSEKIKQIMQMSQIGMIDQSQIAKYLDMPDLRNAFDKASAANDGVEQCIDRAIMYEDYDIPDFVNYQNLAQAIATEENRLYAEMVDDEDDNEEVEESLSRLIILEEKLLGIMQENGFVDLGNDQEEQVVSEDEMLGSGAGSTQVADVTNELDGSGLDSGTSETDQLANPQQLE
jgi:hypothetical protein